METREGKTIISKTIFYVAAYRYISSVKNSNPCKQKHKIYAGQ